MGRVVIEFHAATDARDTDFVASIMDVHPDGRAVNLGPNIGVVRARYRNGFDREELLTPGEVARYEIDLGHIGHSFEPGHRIRIDLTSSAYPAIAPNQNTGNPVATDTEWNTANQIIFHNREYPSRIVLPDTSAEACDGLGSRGSRPRRNVPRRGGAVGLSPAHAGASGQARRPECQPRLPMSRPERLTQPGVLVIAPMRCSGSIPSPLRAAGST